VSVSNAIRSSLLRVLRVAVAAWLPLAALGAQAPLAGTYRLFLCQTACPEADSTKARAIATLVIAGDALAATPAWKTAFDEIRAGRRYMAFDAAANACFNDGTVGSPADKARALLRRHAAGDTIDALPFGLNRNGITRWERDGAGWRMTSDASSPDAETYLRWTSTGDRITGEVWFYGHPFASPPHRTAFFIALRVGSPQVEACR
jgi:hypothetical protein